MRRVFIATALLLTFSATAYAWNNKGHMVIAELAWLKMTAVQRAAATKILATHPHYQEFLAADQPGNMAEDEWVFLRAATWSDWVRNHHAKEYSHPNWHFVDLPFVPPGSHMNPDDHPPEKPNVVTQIPICVDKIPNGTAEDKAIYLCWLLHLVGDIHQPLHCTTLFSEEFPEGDRGGNLALLRIGNGRPTKLHPMWDGLLGKSVSVSSIRGTAREVQDLAEQERDAIDLDLKAHQTAQSWAEEGLESAKKFAYLDGKLDLANSDDDPASVDVPRAPAEYGTNCGREARLCAAKAGERLQKVLVEALK
jgi:hypothetical protein